MFDMHFPVLAAVKLYLQMCLWTRQGTACLRLVVSESRSQDTETERQGSSREWQEPRLERTAVMAGSNWKQQAENGTRQAAK